MIVTAFLQQQATAYEKAVFDAVICMISSDRDDDVDYELLSKVRSFSHGNLVYLFLGWQWDLLI